MTVFSLEEVTRAYYACRKNKRRTISALAVERNLEEQLLSLHEALVSQKYTPGKSIYFVVTKPKPREVFAGEFIDRVVHHLLVNQLQGYFENRVFLDSSYACRPGKGHHYATKQILKFSRQFVWYGQYDIQNFFASINKERLFAVISKHIQKMRRPEWWKAEILWLTKVIVFHDPTKNYRYKGNPALKKLVPKEKSLFNQPRGVGMAIGNLTSQFFANILLNELDYYITKKLGFAGYGRYMDDFIIFANDRKKITVARDKIDKFLREELRLTLHPRKRQIQPTRHGISFVGYFIKPQVVTPRRNTVKKLKARIYEINRAVAREEPTEEQLLRWRQSLNSCYGHLTNARAYNLRRHLYQEHFSPELKACLELAGRNCNKLAIRKGWRACCQRAKKEQKTKKA